MRLLVVTPTLGTSPFLDETMRSVEAVRAQGVPILHILTAPEMRVAELAARFPHTLVLPDAGRAGGIYGAVNCGLFGASPAEWDWFTYINDDDLLAPAFGEVFHRHARPENEGVIAYGDVRNIGENGRSLGLQSVERRRAFFRPLMFAGVSLFTQQGTLVSRRVMLELKGFDATYRLCADLDFWVRTVLAGLRHRYFPCEVARFRIRAGQASHDANLRREERAAILRQIPGKPPGRLPQRLAHLQFYARNLPRYAARIRTVGWRRSNQMLADATLQSAGISKP